MDVCKDGGNGCRGEFHFKILRLIDGADVRGTQACEIDVIFNSTTGMRSAVAFFAVT